MASRSTGSLSLTTGSSSGLSMNSSALSSSSCAAPLATPRVWLATSAPHCQRNCGFKLQGPTQSTPSRVASSFLGTMLREGVSTGKLPRTRGTARVHSELAGQYEESFADVEKRLIDFFTFKAVRVVIKQHRDLLEGLSAESSDPLKPGLPPRHHREIGHRRIESEDDDQDAEAPYRETLAYRDAEWLADFVVNNKVRDSKLFIRSLVQERQELAERIMVTRLHLYNKWAKKYDHAAMHAAIKDQNLELLRERLMETVKFQAEDSEGATS